MSKSEETSSQIRYVGLDVGATELWVAVGGIKPRQFAHTAVGIKALSQWLIKISGVEMVHVCMEATGVYSRHLALKLLELPRLEVSIVNPACIKAYANVQLRRSKTDRLDAEIIRCFAVSQCPASWRPASKTRRQLSELVAQADFIQETLQRCHNRDHAQKYIDDLPIAVRRAQNDLEKTLNKQLQLVEQAIDELCASDTELMQQVNILESIPGIARKSAVRLLAHGREWLTEYSAKALIAHAGLAPHHYQSGTSLNSPSRLDKRGNKKLRYVLYMPALVGSVHNPILRAFYQRLCDNGKPKKLALVACMKKLLLISRSVLKNKIPFNAKFIS